MIAQRRLFQGFTLIELVLVIAIITILAFASFALYTTIPSSATVEAAQQDMIQYLRLAQQQARTGDAGGSVGVYIESTQYTLYIGDSYATRTPSEERVIVLPDTITLSPTMDIHFEEFSGQSSYSGDMTLTHTGTGETRSIRINSLGLIQ